jgi:MFS family permease
VLGALRIRDYRRFWLGSLVSSLGRWIQTIALGWLVYDLTHAATWLGTVSFCGNAPTLFLGLVGGAIADRASRRLIMTASVLLLAAGSLVLALLTYSGHLTLWHVIAISMVSGVATALYTPAMHSMVPALVGPDHLLNAISLNSVQFNLARAGGPAIAGASGRSVPPGASRSTRAASSAWRSCCSGSGSRRGRPRRRRPSCARSATAWATSGGTR